MPVGSQSPKVVALGGGHGLSATLRALRHVSDRLTAVVTVADDGGSSGRLRAELGGLPPGDLRMALTALTDDSEWGRLWAAVMQHRFHSTGPLDNHALGNLLISTMWEITGDSVAGLDWVGRLLSARGRVLPLSTTPLVVEADVSGGTERTVVGQVNVASTSARIERLRLIPADPPACPEAVEAINQADWVVLGPGSWYTSVLVHLLVPAVREALNHTPARRCLALNLRAEKETDGLTAVDHLVALNRHDPELRIDVVLADPSTIEDIDAAEDAARALGASLVMRQVALGDGTARHDPLRLAAAYRDLFDSVVGDVA
ncbi:MAG: uridine diphosphate-N-acetylglucosamine-binding protein YvcK [Promicromonosporaceae bacterium]|nr:uridine diphosphate-N-acetylglucosamine-binding protein YvcK [Promicromonosporaceae bacterium]